MAPTNFWTNAPCSPTQVGLVGNGADKGIHAFKGGIYGKRAAMLPYSGGIYGKRASLLNAVEPSSYLLRPSRAVPFNNGGIYG